MENGHINITLSVLLYLYIFFPKYITNYKSKDHGGSNTGQIYHNIYYYDYLFVVCVLLIYNIYVCYLCLREVFGFHVSVYSFIVSFNEVTLMTNIRHVFILGDRGVGGHCPK